VVKRFWDQATAEPVDGGFAILLDGRPMHLPGGATLRLAHPPLAHAIAAEWHSAGGGKGGEMTFADTPLTRLAGTAQQRVAADPAPAADAIADYAETDLLCYRAEAPAALVRRQAAAWQPWLDWAAWRHRASLRVTAGIVAVRQPRDSIAALRAAVRALDPWALTALGVAVPALGSAVLGLALAEQVLDPDTAHALGALDELFQAEQWGEDAEAAARRQAIADDIAVAARLIALTRDGPTIPQLGPIPRHGP
jgi:chaperone required for assembly of F1-ATPase